MTTCHNQCWQELTSCFLTFNGEPSYLSVATVKCVSGFWWLPGENLGHRWRPALGNTPRPLCRDLWHGRQPWEQSPCLSELWQNHQIVVLTHLCTHHCSAGPWCLHHIHTGETDALLSSYSNLEIGSCFCLFVFLLLLPLSCSFSSFNSTCQYSQN